MGPQKAVILGFICMAVGSSASACDLPDGAARLLQLLDQVERGFRDLKLPKAKTDELSNKARQQLISSHILLRDLDCSAQNRPVITNRLPSEEELSVQRRIIRQNDEIIEELRRRR